VSKDGFETVIDRKQSKMNLSNFLLQYMPLDTTEIKDNEASWWHLKTIIATDQLDNRIQKFLETFQLVHNNEEFAYEGIFDRKEESVMSPINKFNKNRLEMSQMITPIDRSKCQSLIIYS
jgi:hypothetical protein